MGLLEFVQNSLVKPPWGAVYVFGSDDPGGGSGGPGCGYKVWAMVRMVRLNHPNHLVIGSMPIVKGLTEHTQSDRYPHTPSFLP